MASALSGYEIDRLASLSPDRRRASLRVLRELESVVGGDASRIDAASVRRLLDARAATGRSIATVRKERAILLAFSDWCYRHGVIDAATLLALRASRSARAWRRRPWCRTVAVPAEGATSVARDPPRAVAAAARR
jgi:hypothetical protein